MHRVLITGMSGTGKSTLLAALRIEDNIVVDLDYDDWIVYNEAYGERTMDIPRLLRLFEDQQGKDIFLAGCAVNQGSLYPYLTAVIVLTALLSVMHRRIQKRTDHDFGKSPAEWEQIVRDKEEIEPLLIRGSHLVCDTDKDISLVVRDIREYLNTVNPD